MNYITGTNGKQRLTAQPLANTYKKRMSDL